LIRAASGRAASGRAASGQAALDTNILVYAEGLGDAPRVTAARSLIGNLPPAMVYLPAQILGKLFNVLTRKAGYAAGAARDALLSWTDAFDIIPIDPAVMLAAADLAADHQFTIWDAVILSAAAGAGCRLLLSEDMQDGFTWHGTTIVNPFAAAPHKLLTAMLAQGS
jgi:predicted nucleic acid-binding protein